MWFPYFKIEAITRRILWIVSTDEEAKILVFSSWNDVLDLLSHALDANNITYVRMKGGRYVCHNYLDAFCFLCCVAPIERAT